MTKPSSLVKKFNTYHRRVRWSVQRNAISGQVVATCNPTGPIPVGFGRTRVHVDVSGDTVVLDAAKGADGRTDASVGVGIFTTYFNFYAFPATNYPFDFVKAVKRADRSADVRYPWSIARMVVLGLIVLWFLIALLSGGGGSSGASTGDTSGAALVADNPGATETSVPIEETVEAEPSPEDTPEPTATPEETETPAPTPTSALPDEPKDQMTDEIRDLLRTWHEDIVNGDPASAWALLTERKRQQSERKYGFDKWAGGQATLAPYLDPSGLDVSIRDTDNRTGVVTVDVTGMGWSKAGANCSSWSGVTWVRYEDGEWRYDPGYSTTPQRERAWKDRYDELLGGSC
jgi:hypothetical protein